MNRKEFEKINWFDEVNEFVHNHQAQNTTEKAIAIEEGFANWIEQQINQARIDENKHWENICFEQEKPSIKRNDFIERIKYLEI